MVVPAHHAFTLSDHIVHYLLVGAGLGVGSFLKTAWDKFSERFWDKELKHSKKRKKDKA